MHVVIRSVHHQGSERLATERALTVERLRIGRGADQDLPIPDLRAALAHAEVLREGRGFTLLAKTPNGVWVNGAPVQSARLAAGDRIEIGRFELEVLGIEGERLQLALSERHSHSAERAARKAALRTRLRDAGLSARRHAWGLALLILLVGIALPLGLRYGAPAEARSDRTARVVDSALLDDSIWLTGPSSSAHRFFVEDCAACHQQPFVQVQNQACLACHSGLPAHGDAAASQQALQGAQCTDCHREHEDSHGLQASAPQLCQTCHAQPQTGSGLLAAAGFASQHPEFSPRISRFDPATQRFRWEESRQPIAALREDTNLKFPHDRHLDPAGIDAPAGKRVLQCASCHQPDVSGARFEPVRMASHCASCHRLDFDPADPARVLPHAQPEQIRLAIRDYYAARALEGGHREPLTAAADRRRPDAPAPQRSRPSPSAAQWAEAQAQRTLSDLFERRTCHYCHQVEQSGDAAMPWRITPVLTTEQALDKARFNHAAHKTQDCGSCHAAQRSADSREVLLPGISRCRDCHGDAEASAAVPSTCTLCHSFHSASHAAFAGAAPAASSSPVLP